MKNFYPWNVEGLRNWLKQEVGFHQDIESFSKKVNIDTKTIKIWLKSGSYDFAVPITYDQIVSISQFRSLPLEETINWLNLKPSHLEELLSERLSSEK